MHKIFQSLFIIIILTLVLAYSEKASANSVEYVFDDKFFSGNYTPDQYEAADLLFNWNDNYFGGKIFFQDLKIGPAIHIEIEEGGHKDCIKQVRGFYINSARGNRVRPLDEDSLAYLQSVDSSYNDLIMTGGLYVCSQPSNGVIGSIEHNWKGEIYRLIAGLELDFNTNDYLPSFQGGGNFLFEDDTTTGYLWDSYGGIAQIIGSGLNVQYVCGNGYIEENETCDDGEYNGTLNYCNLNCNAITTSVCGNAVVETKAGETCDEGSGINGQAGHCNLACNGIITQQSSNGGGGGGGNTINKDICPENRSCSSSYYDKLCGPCSLVEKVKEKITDIIYPEIDNKPKPSIQGSPFANELNNAYLRAYEYNITSMPTIQKANLKGTLIRKDMAKMISNFAINVLNKDISTGATCDFSDVSGLNKETKYYITVSCKLGLMGYESDGITVKKTFNPNEEVDRAQFGTILSRLLRGEANNGSKPFYNKHLQELKKSGIMTKIDTPTQKEMRGRVMLMMLRVFDEK